MNEWMKKSDFPIFDHKTCISELNFLNLNVFNIPYMGPYNAGPNFTLAPLTPALITPVSKIPFPPFRAGVKRAARYIY